MSDLLKINVNEHTEKKNGLTYLSWAWAWAEVLKHDPMATWKVESFGDGILCAMPDGTAFVSVTATIKGLPRNCFLPVMDNRNKAIPQPNAFDVNKAIMRCLAKAIAMHGLGLYIYAGEDLPEGEETRETFVKRAADAAIAKFNAGNEYGAYEEVCGITDNEEMLLLWGYLGKENSALRASIKKQAAEQRERDAAIAAMPKAKAPAEAA